jgi:hypothetical protein
MVGQIRLGKVNVLGKIVSSNKVSAYKFTDAELTELKTEFGNYDTSGDGRFVTFRRIGCFPSCVKFLLSRISVAIFSFLLLLNCSLESSLPMRHYQH